MIALILAVISFAKEKRRIFFIYGAVFIVATLFTVSSIFKLFLDLTQTVKKSIEYVKENFEEDTYQNFDSLDRVRDLYFEEMKNLSPENIRKNLPKAFYTDYDSIDSVYTLPLVYPYRIEMLDNEDDEGYLMITDNSHSLYLDSLEGIIELCFDKNFLIVKRDLSTFTNDSLFFDKPEVTYFLFEFKTGNAKSFYNQKSLFEEAKKVGFAGKGLKTLQDYFSKIDLTERED